MYLIPPRIVLSLNRLLWIANIIFSWLSHKIILLVYGNQHVESIKIVKILVWATAFVFLTTTMTHTTRASNRQRFTAKIVVSGAAINLLLNLILIPRIGFIGAPISYLLTELFIFVSHFIYLSRHIMPPPLFKFIPKVVLINFIVGVYIYYFVDLNIFLLIFSAIVINLIMIVVTRYFTSNEISKFMHSLKIANK